MPELPETETIARDLNQLVSGRVISRATVCRPDVLRRVNSTQLNGRLAGRTISRVWRRAKSIVLDLDDQQRILVQPRFTGSIRELPESDAPGLPYGCVQVDLANGRSLVYADVRRLGTFTLVTPAQFRSFDDSLGLEPLDPEFTADRLSGILRASQKFVKALLMDQRRIAGCGNIYANEALWIARIDPSRRSASITRAEAERLRDSLFRVLSASVEARGTTFRDYRDARGERGEFANQLKAYGRGGKPCLRCSHRLALTHCIDGRATVFCFWCQS